MSMNKYMHPRNIYRDRPNFIQLAADYPEFREHVKLDICGKATIDFKSSCALRALSRALLKKDFNLDVEMPLDKLVPTVPLRLNYILWIEDLLQCLGKTENVIGIDIGTGASCVIPLLAAKKNNWKMLATESDVESIVCAQRNVTKNKMEHLITVIPISDNSLLDAPFNIEREFDFCMCNPPFFASTQELHPFFKSRKQNRPHPKNAFVAGVNEVVTEGGELKFIHKIIDESKILGTKIKIYTTMVGCKSHLPDLKQKLREAKVHSFNETKFCQGNTTRWGLAWTYLDLDIRKVSAVATKRQCKYKPLLYELPSQETSPENIVKVTEVILGMFKGLNMSIEDVTRNKLHPRYFVTASSNTWAHQRRQRRKQLKKIVEASIVNKNTSGTKPTSPKSPGKRNLEDICDSTLKKLRLSTDSEDSETAAVFLKFMCVINIKDNQIIVELHELDNITNRENLHQILQYIKNNFDKNMSERSLLE